MIQKINEELYDEAVAQQTTKNTDVLVAETIENNNLTMHAEADIPNCDPFPTFTNNRRYIMDQSKMDNQIWTINPTLKRLNMSNLKKSLKSLQIKSKIITTTTIMV